MLIGLKVSTKKKLALNLLHSKRPGSQGGIQIVRLGVGKSLEQTSESLQTLGSDIMNYSISQLILFIGLFVYFPFIAEGAGGLH